MPSTHWTEQLTDTGDKATLDITPTQTVGFGSRVQTTIYEDVGNDGSGAQTDALGNSYDNATTVDLLPTVDAFEDGNLTEYTTGSGSFGTQTTAVFEDTTAGECTAPNGSPDHAISTSGLDFYPEAGDSVQFAIYTSSNSSGNELKFLFGCQDTTYPGSAYAIHFDFANGNLSLQRSDGAGFSDIGTTASFTYDVGAWMLVDLRWGSSGDITVDVYQTVPETFGNSFSVAGTASVTGDTTYTSGGYGWYGESSGLLYFDAVRIYSMGTPRTIQASGFDDGGTTNLYWAEIETYPYYVEFGQQSVESLDVVSASAGGQAQTVNAPTSTATATTPTPTVSGTGTASVSAGTGVVATSSPTPTISGAGAATVSAPTAIATSSTPAPSITAGGVVISVPVAEATASSPAPTISPTSAAVVGIGSDTVVADSIAPTIGVGGAIVSVPTDVLGTVSPDPTVTTDASIIAVPTAIATTTTPSPSVSGSGAATVTTQTDAIASIGPTPSIAPSASAIVATTTDTQTAETPNISVAATGSATIQTPTSTTSAVTIAPEIFTGARATIFQIATLDGIFDPTQTLDGIFDPEYTLDGKVN